MKSAVGNPARVHFVGGPWDGISKIVDGEPARIIYAPALIMRMSVVKDASEFKPHEVLVYVYELVGRTPRTNYFVYDYSGLMER